MESLKLVTLNGNTVGSFEVKDNEVIVRLEGQESFEELLENAQRTGKSVGLRIFTLIEEDDQI